MTRHARAYRALVRAYPRRFRAEFADEMVRDFDHLVRDLGPARSWSRTLLDLAVTVPRYRLESFMEPRRSTSALTVTATALAALGIVAILTVDFAPGIALILVAAGVVVTQRSRLARSIRPPDPDRRRRLVRRGAILAVICVVSTTLAWIELSVSENWHGGKVVVYNALFFVTAIGAVVCFVGAIRSPASAASPPAGV